MKCKSIIALFLILLLSVNTAFAYNLYEDGKRYKWHRYSNNPVWVDASSYNSSWQSVVNDSINDINAGGADFGYINKRGRIEVAMGAHTLYAGANEISAPLGRTTYSSYTYYSGNKTFVITSAAIAINTNVTWSNPGVTNKSYDLRSTISHELGHVAGLFHHNGNNSMMTPLTTMGQIRRFGSDDADGLIAIYGRR